MKNILTFFEHYIKNEISRKQFLKICMSGVALSAVESQCMKLAVGAPEPTSGRKKSGKKGLYDLVVSEGPDPYKNTIRTIEAMGGMQRFVGKGDIVVIKPNMAWDRTPEQAANTNPKVVCALIDLAFLAGAKKVNVFDIPCNDEKRVHVTTGIAAAAKERGANVYFVDHWNIVKAKFNYESPMSDWPIFRDAVTCDTFINVPVVKHHGLTGLTLSMKNLMGVCSGNRGLMHMGIGRKVVDVTDYINPDLTVMDATRVLFRNGPTGGDLKDVRMINKVFAAIDPTLADSFACSLLDQDPMSISYIQEAFNRKMGNVDISKAKIQTVTC